MRIPARRSRKPNLLRKFLSQPTIFIPVTFTLLFALFFVSSQFTVNNNEVVTDDFDYSISNYGSRSLLDVDITESQRKKADKYNEERRDVPRYIFFTNGNHLKPYPAAFCGGGAYTTENFLEYAESILLTSALAFIVGIVALIAGAIFWIGRICCCGGCHASQGVCIPGERFDVDMGDGYSTRHVWIVKGAIIVVLLVMVPFFVVGQMGNKSTTTSVQEFGDTILDAVDSVLQTLEYINTTIANLNMNNTIPTQFNIGEELSKGLDTGQQVYNKGKDLENMVMSYNSIRESAILAGLVLPLALSALGVVAALANLGPLAIVPAVLGFISLLVGWISFGIHYSLSLLLADLCGVFDNGLDSIDISGLTGDQSNLQVEALQQPAQPMPSPSFMELELASTSDGTTGFGSTTNGGGTTIGFATSGFPTDSGTTGNGGGGGGNGGSSSTSTSTGNNNNNNNNNDNNSDSSKGPDSNPIISSLLQCGNDSSNPFDPIKQIAIDGLDFAFNLVCEGFLQACNQTYTCYPNGYLAPSSQCYFLECPGTAKNNCSKDTVDQFLSSNITDFSMGCVDLLVEDVDCSILQDDGQLCASGIYAPCNVSLVLFRDCPNECRQEVERNSTRLTIEGLTLLDAYNDVLYNHIFPLLNCDTITSLISSIEDVICVSLVNNINDIAVSEGVLSAFLIPAVILSILGIKRFNLKNRRYEDDGPDTSTTYGANFGN
eukprot:TRINITY_DN73_c0_g1_i4.p1 TRINITY_DN73_c0_g1~~TRINITY_DN73_c0_g1_i4.p1  ORF type:complete len:791 (+),score=186.27 TRINITY_DN73_c0_g1_i4:221-2374(+)